MSQNTLIFTRKRLSLLINILEEANCICKKTYLTDSLIIKAEPKARGLPAGCAFGMLSPINIGSDIS